MKLYAETPRFRNRQILQDAALVGWAGLWVWIGTHTRALIERLAEPGRVVERAGDGFAGTLMDIGSRIAEVPLVGETLREPFNSAADAGAALESAGIRQQEVVHTLALWLGVLLAVIPISYVLYKYVPDRLRWVREASAAHDLRIDADDLHLFAIRAVARQPLYELRRVCADPAAALQNGDYEPLAGLELASLGLAMPPAPSKDTG